MTMWNQREQPLNLCGAAIADTNFISRWYPWITKIHSYTSWRSINTWFVPFGSPFWWDAQLRIHFRCFPTFVTTIHENFRIWLFQRISIQYISQTAYMMVTRIRGVPGHEGTCSINQQIPFRMIQHPDYIIYSWGGWLSTACYFAARTAIWLSNDCTYNPKWPLFMNARQVTFYHFCARFSLHGSRSYCAIYVFTSPLW